MRLRWLTGLTLPEPVWFGIGLGIFLLGVVLFVWPLWTHFGAIAQGGRGWPRGITGPIALVLIGGALITIGWVEMRDAVSNTRGRN
jgi:hypothetical protein